MGVVMRMAITGLDPHCGDDGAINDYDIKVTRGAVEWARGTGIPLEGPFAADTIFLSEKWEKS